MKGYLLFRNQGMCLLVMYLRILLYVCVYICILCVCVFSLSLSLSLSLFLSFSAQEAADPLSIKEQDRTALVNLYEEAIAIDCRDIEPYYKVPQPYTLHPTPCTLHPTPYTLNHKP